MTEISKAQSAISLLADQGIVIRKEEEQSEVFVVKVPRTWWRVVVSDDGECLHQAAETRRR